MNWIKDELQTIKQKGLLRTLTFLETAQGPHIRIKGSSYINFSSNNYLDLSGHPQITNAAIRALKKYGLGSGASRMLSGSMALHDRLEKQIAAFKQTEAALTFNSGYAANTGIIPAIADEDSMIFSDELNHASIIDGTRMSKGDKKIYKHRDMDNLEALLKKSAKREKVKRRLIITDTVFSMDGDIALLPDLVFLCQKYRASLLIDDAHATGVIGKNGRGGLEHFEMDADNIIQMGTLSKAAGCSGGYVAGSKELIDFLINRARSFIYSTSYPPALAAAGVSALRILEKRSTRRLQRLWRNTRRLLSGLKEMGFNTLGSETPIVPILVGNASRALTIARYLYEQKIFAPAIRPPTVPEGMSRIRFSVTAGHTDEDIDRVLYCAQRMK